MDLKELIDKINQNTIAQKEQNEKWERDLGLAPLKIQEREPTELELLLQKWEQAGEAALSPEPEGVELPSREPEGVELPSREPEGVELLSREPEGVELLSREPEGVELLSREPEGVELPSREPEGVELPSREPEGVELPSREPEGVDLPSRESEGVELPSREPEEARTLPPPQPRPPPLETSLVLPGTVPCPLLLETLPVCIDLPARDLEPRSLHHRSQLYTWFPTPLSPNTQTSLGCCQMSLVLPLFAASLPLGDRTSLRRSSGGDLCLLLQSLVSRPSLQSALSSRWGPVSPGRGPSLEAPEGPTHPQVCQWKRAKIRVIGLEGGWSFKGGGK
ncbi:UNVERIFIED_CONTAM: hypothetical protein FKN15_002830 [Acipenser sinensis]